MIFVSVDLHSQQRLLVMLAVEALGGVASKRATLDYLERNKLIALDAWLRERLTTRSEPRWRNMLSHSRGELEKHGHLSGERRDAWTLTQTGSEELARLRQQATVCLDRGEPLKWLGHRARGLLGVSVGDLAPTADRDELERRVQRLLSYPLSRPVGQVSPERVMGPHGTVFKRDPKVVAWTLQEAKGRCEACKMLAPFATRTGPYLEVHHVVRLADGGPDTLENTVAVCPNCHRELHHGRHAEERASAMVLSVSRLRPPPRR